MSCYSLKYRRCCNSYVAFISAAMFILSIGVIIIGMIQSGHIVPPDYKKFGIKVNINQSGYALPVLIMGFITLFTAMLGCCVCRC